MTPRRAAARCDFSGVDGKLGCDDCHNPHDAYTVNPFRGERFRGGLGLTLGYRYPDTAASSKLLKRRPSGSTSETAEYGSDWCAGCHAGRMSGGALHNHPVDSKLSTTTPFDYNHVALVSSDGLTNATMVLGSMTRLYASKPTNRGYLMPWPRTGEQGAHLPICQQCHEGYSPCRHALGGRRRCGHFTVTPVEFASQYPATDNPRFQNFPHETANERMLVETADDLCTNCHPATTCRSRPAGCPLKTGRQARDGRHTTGMSVAVHPAVIPAASFTSVNIDQPESPRHSVYRPLRGGQPSLFATAESPPWGRRGYSGSGGPP